MSKERDIHDVREELDEAFFHFNEVKIRYAANRNPVEYFKLGTQIRKIADLIEEMELMYKQEKGNLLVS